jgi:glycerol-3-phosphate dehydrogenase
VGGVLQDIVHQAEAAKLRMVKGSHIVVDRLYDHATCYIFQNGDGRIEFAIPYEGQFTLIGTTDMDFEGDPSKIEITPEETDYLLRAAGAYLKRPITKEMIRWSYAGVRPLYDDGASSAQSATRDYVLKLEGANDAPQLLSVFGGKITTSRKLAEAAVNKLSPLFPQMKKAWTASAKLPGGMEYSAVADYMAKQQKAFSFLKPQNVARLFRAYGTRMEDILGDARFASDLGQWFGPLCEREVEFLIREEFAMTADDILWRRSKLGLHLKPADIAALEKYMASRTQAPPVGTKAKRGAKVKA